MPEPIVFYDIPRKATVPSENAWSPNTWKTRYSLNIKGLAYKTVWIEYPDIEALYKKLGVEPVDIGPTGAPYCGLPLIYDPNTGAKVNDSASIARYLDKTYPDTPTLIPKETDALHAAFQRAFAAVLISGNGDFPSLMMPETQARLNPASQGYFRRTREEWFGTALEELAPHGSEKRRKHWEGVKNAFHEVAGWLQAGGQDNLVFLGNQRICYADVTVAAFLVWLRITFGEASEEWKDVLTWDGGRWAKFAEAFREYEHVDEGSSLVL
ncbi:hypothetical protein L226DRAFT_518873 [Lentinus tigrinus ALCF2SS1-7]|uniref:GST N-terminal domain-containing protein n=1 Tax=Lentinus tigrinus ALCF2SS1-6 TaxID=1328759 RepID=A0A5C2SU14_9APHY|nr:hypothetical protein L227DRAFT_558932 [Lentinus tigrinus ALCF2SS1-6]RPD80724.1 hypothetical protein L226DRAFT_518873 [Lentinus tigrinus ALCF2SS1-7]